MITIAVATAIISAVITVWGIPSFPPELVATMNTLPDYLRMGLGYLRIWLGDGAMSALGITVAAISALWVLREGYDLIMWVLRKIPFLGIE